MTPGTVLTLTPGPAGATPAALAALSQPILHHQDPAFLALYAETVELLGRAFGTASVPVIFPGEAVVGLEAAAASLIAPGDVVLNLVSGVFGRAFGQTARQCAGEVIAHMGPAAYPLGPVIALTVLGRALRRLGAAADIGAAVEAALAQDPLYQRGLSGIPAAKRPGTESGGPP